MALELDFKSFWFQAHVILTTIAKGGQKEKKAEII